MASLLELQRAFGAALRDPAVSAPVLPPENLDIYRNNAAITFRESLELTFPVVRRRVGDDYFRQLCAHYRQRFPSRNGDLHWVGRDFAGFLGEYLRDGDYAWLADLARVEWACSECSVSDEQFAQSAERLAEFAPEVLENLRFQLQPSLRLLESAYPVFSVWLGNQAENAPPVDQSLGPERGLVRSCDEQVEVRKLPSELFAFLSTLQRGGTLGEAIDAAGFDEPRLTRALALLFGERLVVSITGN